MGRGRHAASPEVEAKPIVWDVEVSVLKIPAARFGFVRLPNIAHWEAIALRERPRREHILLNGRWKANCDMPKRDLLENSLDWFAESRKRLNISANSFRQRVMFVLPSPCFIAIEENYLWPSSNMFYGVRTSSMDRTCSLDTTCSVAKEHVPRP